MPLNLADLAGQLPVWEDDRFAGTISLGLRGMPSNARTTWIIVEVANRNTTNIRIGELASQSAGEVPFNATLAIAATMETWRHLSARGHPGLLEKVVENRFYTTGEAGFFVRFLVPLSQLLVIFGDWVARQTPSVPS